MRFPVYAMAVRTTRMGHKALICQSCNAELDPTEIRGSVDETIACPHCQHTSFGI